MSGKVAKKIVVSGAGGFLGRNLISRFLNCEGFEIVAITSKRPGFFGTDRVVMIGPEDWDAAHSELSDADVLLNCAFPRNCDGEAMARGLAFIDRLFAEAGRNKECSVINVSSQSVYSQRDPKPATEDDRLCLESRYAVGKYATELLLDARCQRNKRTSIRLASLIGPGFDQRVVNKMVAKALNGEGLTVAENASRFGYLDVRDAVEALVSLCSEFQTSDWEGVYNVGPSGSYTLTDIAQSVREVCREFLDGAATIGLEIAESNAPCIYSALDSTRFRRLTGWSGRISLEDSIASIAGAMESAPYSRN